MRPLLCPPFLYKLPCCFLQTPRSGHKTGRTKHLLGLNGQGRMTTAHTYLALMLRLAPLHMPHVDHFINVTVTLGQSPQ